MIIIINGKSFNNYKCLFIILGILYIIHPSFCSKKINDYLVKNINYDKNKNDITIDLEYDKTKKFDIKNYDIENIRPNSKIKLIKNLKFYGRALTP